MVDIVQLHQMVRIAEQSEDLGEGLHNGMTTIESRRRSDERSHRDRRLSAAISDHCLINGLETAATKEDKPCGTEE